MATNRQLNRRDGQGGMNRIAHLSPFLTVWLAVTLTFWALRVMPGDSFDARLRHTGLSATDIAQQRTLYGLDQPVLVQYGKMWRDLLGGDLGRSLVTREPVADMIAVRLQPTITLAGAALAVAAILGLGMGSIAAQSSRLGSMAASCTALSLAAPAYWTATLAIYVASRPPLDALNIPTGGNRAAWNILLPAIVLGIPIGGGIARVIAVTLKEAYAQTFIHAARGRGLGMWHIYHHALRASLPPILSIIALQTGFLLGGTVMIEMIFTRRGLGSLMLTAVDTQDFPLVQSLVLLSALMYTMTRAVSAGLSRLADPRLRA